MTPNQVISEEDAFAFYPVDWDQETFHKKFIELLGSMVEESGSSIPVKRIIYQIEQTPEYRDVSMRWSKISGMARIDAWKTLLERGESILKELLPTCVECGECCRRGSPTIMLDDLELLRKGKIPWTELVTLRRSEPVRSPIKESIFFLLDERIKIREKAGTQECVFLDGANDQCTIYADRPLQCRAQACWDAKQAQDVAEQPYLTRRDIFDGVELLLDLMAEHDRRCSFEKLDAAFKHLAEHGEEAVGELLDLMAYEDHFRRFMGEQLKIPADTSELVFGRSFADLALLFGFRVEEDSDGSRCLVPDAS
jgi:Fe-S-cluster containining protein